MPRKTGRRNAPFYGCKPLAAGVGVVVAAASTAGAGSTAAAQKQDDDDDPPQIGAIVIAVVKAHRFHLTCLS
jgi:hypothetical protein